MSAGPRPSAIVDTVLCVALSDFFLEVGKVLELVEVERLIG